MHRWQTRRSLVAVPAIVWITACAQPAPAPTPDPLTPPSTFQYAPFSASYLFVSKGQTDQEMPSGAAASTTYGFTIGLTATVRAEPDGLRATIRVDSVPSLTGAAALVAGNIRRAVGRSVSASMFPSGRLEGDAAPDPTLGSLPQVAMLLREFFPKIPEQGLTAGDRWTDSTRISTHSNGLDIVIEAQRSYEALQWTEWAGTRTLEVVADVVYTMRGSGSMSAQAISLVGQGTRQERFFLSEHGSLVGSVVRDSSRADATVAGMGVTIPVTQTRSDTLQVIP